jgi:hypothetical protein
MAAEAGIMSIHKDSDLKADVQSHTPKDGKASFVNDHIQAAAQEMKSHFLYNLTTNMEHIRQDVVPTTILSSSNLDISHRVQELGLDLAKDLEDQDQRPTAYKAHMQNL